MATAREVAAWLQAEFEREGHLTQADAVAGIRARFGPEFVTRGRLRRDVLLAFRQLAPEGRVWVGSRHAWRRRDHVNPPPGPGRRGSGPPDA
jgi:hypothetical protein